MVWFHTGAGVAGDDGFGVVGDADAGVPQHVQVVGAVADGHGLIQGQGVGLGEVVQGGAFGGAVQDGVAEASGEGGAVIQQGIGAMFVKTEFLGHAAGKVGEAAGNQRADGAVRAPWWQPVRPHLA